MCMDMCTDMQMTKCCQVGLMGHTNVQWHGWMAYAVAWVHGMCCGVDVWHMRWHGCMACVMAWHAWHVRWHGMYGVSGRCILQEEACRWKHARHRLRVIHDILIWPCMPRISTLILAYMLIHPCLCMRKHACPSLPCPALPRAALPRPAPPQPTSPMRRYLPSYLSTCTHPRIPTFLSIYMHTSTHTYLGARHDPDKYWIELINRGAECGSCLFFTLALALMCFYN